MPPTRDRGRGRGARGQKSPKGSSSPAAAVSPARATRSSARVQQNEKKKADGGTETTENLNKAEESSQEDSTVLESLASQEIMESGEVSDAHNDSICEAESKAMLLGTEISTDGEEADQMVLGSLADTSTEGDDDIEIVTESEESGHDREDVTVSGAGNQVEGDVEMAEVSSELAEAKRDVESQLAMAEVKGDVESQSAMPEVKGDVESQLTMSEINVDISPAAGSKTSDATKNKVTEDHISDSEIDHDHGEDVELQGKIDVSAADEKVAALESECDVMDDEVAALESEYDVIDDSDIIVIDDGSSDVENATNADMKESKIATPERENEPKSIADARAETEMKQKMEGGRPQAIENPENSTTPPGNHFWQVRVFPVKMSDMREQVDAWAGVSKMAIMSEYRMTKALLSQGQVDVEDTTAGMFQFMVRRNRLQPLLRRLLCYQSSSSQLHIEMRQVTLPSGCFNPQRTEILNDLLGEVMFLRRKFGNKKNNENDKTKILRETDTDRNQTEKPEMDITTEKLEMDITTEKLEMDITTEPVKCEMEEAGASEEGLTELKPKEEAVKTEVPDAKENIDAAGDTGKLCADSADDGQKEKTENSDRNVSEKRDEMVDNEDGGTEVPDAKENIDAAGDTGELCADSADDGQKEKTENTDRNVSEKRDEMVDNENGGEGDTNVDTTAPVSLGTDDKSADGADVAGGAAQMGADPDQDGVARVERGAPVSLRIFLPTPKYGLKELEDSLISKESEEEPSKGQADCQIMLKNLPNSLFDETVAAIFPFAKLLERNMEENVGTAVFETASSEDVQKYMNIYKDICVSFRRVQLITPSEENEQSPDKKRPSEIGASQASKRRRMGETDISTLSKQRGTTAQNTGKSFSGNKKALCPHCKLWFMRGEQICQHIRRIHRRQPPLYLTRTDSNLTHASRPSAAADHLASCSKCGGPHLHPGDNHKVCLSCVGCSPTKTCHVCTDWKEQRWVNITTYYQRRGRPLAYPYSAVAAATVRSAAETAAVRSPSRTQTAREKEAKEPVADRAAAPSRPGRREGGQLSSDRPDAGPAGRRALDTSRRSSHPYRRRAKGPNQGLHCRNCLRKGHATQHCRLRKQRMGSIAQQAEEGARQLEELYVRVAETQRNLNFIQQQAQLVEMRARRGGPLAQQSMPPAPLGAGDGRSGPSFSRSAGFKGPSNRKFGSTTRRAGQAHKRQGQRRMN